MSIGIRPAVSADAAALVAIDAFAQGSAQRRIQIAYWVEGGQCFLAEQESQIVGYCVLTKDFFHSFFIELVVVDEHVRRSGVGAALIGYLADFIPPGEKLWTSTNKSNLPMQGLLTKLGFIESGFIENLDEGDPEIVFVRLP